MESFVQEHTYNSIDRSLQIVIIQSLKHLLITLILTTLPILQILITTCSFREFSLQCPVLLLKLINSFLEAIHMFLCTNAEFFNDFKEAPKTQNNDKRGDLFKYTME